MLNGTITLNGSSMKVSMNDDAAFTWIITFEDEHGTETTRIHHGFPTRQQANRSMKGHLARLGNYQVAASGRLLEVNEIFTEVK